MGDLEVRPVTLRHCMVATAMSIVQAKNVWRAWWREQMGPKKAGR